MADYIEHQDKGELVANCDQLQNDEVVVTTPVESRIMSIRGKQIMIDRDLAELYGVETRVLNQAVKRNMERFPERFRFQLTKEEMAELVTNCDRFNSLKHSTVRSNVHYVGSIKDPNGGYGYPMIKDYSDFLKSQQKMKNK